MLPVPEQAPSLAGLNYQVPGWVGGLATAAQALSGTTKQQKWKIEARFDIKGLDLSSSRKVSVNLDM